LFSEKKMCFFSPESDPYAAYWEDMWYDEDDDYEDNNEWKEKEKNLISKDELKDQYKSWIQSIGKEIEGKRFFKKLKEIEDTWFKWIEEEYKDDININSFHESFQQLAVKHWLDNVIDRIKDEVVEEENVIWTWTEKSFIWVRDLFIKEWWYNAKNEWDYETEWEAIYKLVLAFEENLKNINHSKENIEKDKTRIQDKIDKDKKEWSVDYDIDEIYEKIKLQWVWVSLWAAKWLWASFDISAFTKWWIDNLDVWIVKVWDNNYVPWIWISKWLFDIDIDKDWDTKLSSIAWVNTAWIFINAWIKHIHTEDLKSAFQEQKSWDFFDNFVVWWNINYINVFWFWEIIAVWAHISEADHESFQWAEKMVKQMWPVMDKILEECKNWTPSYEIWNTISKIMWEFEWIEKTTEQDKDEIEKKYQEIKEVFESLTKWLDENWKNEIAIKLKRSALQQYSNRLHKNNEWFNFTWIWAWIALIAWFIPTPYIIATWEYNYQKTYETVDTFADEASRSIENWDSWKTIKNTFWAKEVNKIFLKTKDIDWKEEVSYNKKWYNVIELSKNLDMLNIKADTESWIQIHDRREDEWKIYISSSEKSLKMHLLKLSDNDTISYDLIFWDPKNAKIENIKTQITNSIETEKVLSTPVKIEISKAISEFPETKNSILTFSQVMNKKHTTIVNKLDKKLKYPNYGIYEASV
jgi:hypothetical protein